MTRTISTLRRVALSRLIAIVPPRFEKLLATYNYHE